MTLPELPNIVDIFARHSNNPGVSEFLHTWENLIYSFFVMGIIIVVAYLSSRKLSVVPGKLQNAAEVVVGGMDEFVCGILGPHGRKYTPFIGTLFIYILFMNLLGLIPFMKSPTSSWSTTLALALCVFVYVQYTAIKELGFFGYFKHLAGNPKGAMALSIVLPVFMFSLHLMSELIKPISLSLRLRSNIWGGDLLLAVLAGFGLKGLPLLLVNTFSEVLVAVVQAAVFCLLSTVYFAIVLVHEE